MPRLYLSLLGAGGNIGVSVGEDGVVIVDDQYAPLAPKIESALKTITDKPVRFILNTHYHGDHTDGHTDGDSVIWFTSRTSCTWATTSSTARSRSWTSRTAAASKV